jgi:hypothetical protein
MFKLPLIFTYLLPKFQNYSFSLAEFDWILGNYSQATLDIISFLFFHVFSEGSMAGMYEKIFRLLWYSAMPCADLDGLNMNPLLKECSYSGKKYK